MSRSQRNWPLFGPLNLAIYLHSGLIFDSVVFCITADKILSHTECQFYTRHEWSCSLVLTSNSPHDSAVPQITKLEILKVRASDATSVSSDEVEGLMPRRCPHPNPWDLWIYYITWQEGIKFAGIMKDTNNFSLKCRHYLVILDEPSNDKDP
jgi:hypothetical protein